MNTTGFFLLFALIYVVVATRCIIEEGKKSQEEPEIHVIHLDDGENDSSEPEVIALHIPDKRKREIWDSSAKSFCKKNEDCASGEMCVARLRCVKINKKIDSKKKEIAGKTKA